MAKVSTKGYKKNSKDKNEPYLKIPSNMITMKEDDGTPLRKGPILGIDNFGNQQLMMPGADYQFPGNSVYEIPMAKMGGTKKVRIHSLPKAETGGEKDKPKEKPKDKPKEEVIWTAGTHELWEPLPEMTPEESNQWMSLRGDAIPITGNFATNQQIYATYRRAKEMGLGYDEYMGKQMSNLQKKRESIVPKPIPGWSMSTDELEQLSKLPESPVFYDGNTGQYSFAHTEAYDPSQDWVGARGPVPGVTRGDVGLYINPKMFNERAENLNKQNAQRIELFNSGQINQADWEKIYGSPYDPNLDYTVTPEELKASYWKGPSKDLKRKGVYDSDFPGYEYNKYNAKDIYTYTHHLTPDELIMRDAYQGAKADMNTPLAKFLGSKGEPPRSVLERNYRISADNLANEAIGKLQGIIGNKANSERFRSMLDMDPKIFQDIVNSPFRSGSITLDTNKHGWGQKQTINDKEANDILRSIEFIKRSGKYNFLLDPSPADMAIQGIGNTLSWMAGNDNAEGPGTIGEAFHDFTGYNAHNKGYSLANTFESPLVAGRNIVENIATPFLSDYKGTSGIRTIDDPGYDFFTEVPTMRGMNMTWNPNYSQLENDIANFTYTAAQDAAFTGIGMAARPFVNKAFNTFGSTFGNNYFTDSKSYRPNRSIANDIRFNNVDPKVGMDMSNYEVAGELAKTKSQYVSPFDLSKYNFAPGSKTGRLKGKPLFGDVGTSNTFSTNNKVLSAEGAKHFNNKYGLNYKQFDEISPADLQNHIGDVFDYHAPKPSKTPGGVKFKPNFLNDAGDADSGFKISNKWTKDQLAAARNRALDFDSSGLNLAGPLRKNLGSQIAAGGLYSIAGAGGLLIGNALMESEGKPLYNKAVPYLNAGARQLGINSNPFSLATPSGSSSTQGTKQQVMMSLNDEGNNVSSARVNETAEGDVIIGGEFIEGANNTVNKASWFNENPDASISDKNFTVRDAKGFYGVEKGKFKAGKLEDFDPETVVVPIRPFANSYEPIKQAGVTKDNTLRLITDPKDPDNPDSGIIYNNAAQSGKMMFYSPSNKNAWFIYNADPATTSEQINKLIQENPDIRYVPIDNGRYEHYVDKQDGPLNENDFKEYYAADVGRQGNPGYNIVLKRKPKQEQGKKLGGAIYRTGGEVPKPKFQNGGDISIPDLRRVKIDSLPKAQPGLDVKQRNSFIPMDADRYGINKFIPQGDDTQYTDPALFQQLQDLQTRINPLAQSSTASRQQYEKKVLDAINKVEPQNYDVTTSGYIPESVRQSEDVRNNGLNGCISGVCYTLNEAGEPVRYYSNSMFQDAIKAGTEKDWALDFDTKNISGGDIVQFTRDHQGPHHAALVVPNTVVNNEDGTITFEAFMNSGTGPMYRKTYTLDPKEDRVDNFRNETIQLIKRKSSSDLDNLVAQREQLKNQIEAADPAAFLKGRARRWNTYMPGAFTEVGVDYSKFDGQDPERLVAGSMMQNLNLEDAARLLRQTTISTPKPIDGVNIKFDSKYDIDYDALRKTGGFENILNQINDPEFKMNFMKDMNITNREYNALVSHTFGIYGQETGFGTKTGGIKETDVARKTDSIWEDVKSRLKGEGSLKKDIDEDYSRGLTQVKLRNIKGQDKRQYGINKESIDADPTKAFLAAMINNAQNLPELRKLASKGETDALGMNNYLDFIPYMYNQPNRIRRGDRKTIEEALAEGKDPAQALVIDPNSPMANNEYIKNVRTYSDIFKFMPTTSPMPIEKYGGSLPKAQLGVPYYANPKYQNLTYKELGDLPLAEQDAIYRNEYMTRYNIGANAVDDVLGSSKDVLYTYNGDIPYKTNPDEFLPAGVAFKGEFPAVRVPSGVQYSTDHIDWDNYDPDLRDRYFRSVDKVKGWNKQWYTGRATLPQFKDVAEKRLAQLLDVDIQPYGSAEEYEKKFPESGGRYRPFMNDIVLPPFTFGDPSVIHHELSHLLDYNVPQTPGGLPFPSYNSNDPVLNNIIPYEYKQPYGGLTNILNSIGNGEVIKASDKASDKEGITIPFADKSNVFSNGFLSPGKAPSEYYYEPTEIRARINEWRFQNKIDPTKNYTEEEIQKIIDDDIKYNQKGSYDLYKLVRGRADLLKKIHDSQVSTGDKNTSDQLPKAQDGTSLTRMTDEDLERVRAIEDKPEQTTFYITPDKKTNELIGQVQFNPDTADAFKTLVDSPDKKLRVVNYPYGYSYMAPGHIEAAAWDTTTNQPINSIGNSQTRVNRWDSGNLRVDGDYEDPSKVRTADLNLNPARLAQFLKYSNTPQDYNFLMDNCADGVCRALGMDSRLYTTLGITDPARVMDHVINSGEFNPTNVQGRRVDIPEGLGTIFDNQVYDPYVKPYIDKGWNYGKQIVDDAWNQQKQILDNSWNYLFKKEGGELDKYQRKGQVINPNFKPSYDWRVSPEENAELNRRAELAGHNSVDEYRASGWAWQPEKTHFTKGQGTGIGIIKAQPKQQSWGEKATERPKTPQSETSAFSNMNLKKMNQDLISGSAVAESTRPANTFKPPLEWEGLTGAQIIDQMKAQAAYDALPEAAKRHDTLTADTRSDSEKLARKAWTALSHPMETLAAVSRGYSIPYGYMGMHNPYEGLGIGSPMTSVVDLAAGIPGFLANAAYRQGEKIVDNPGEYLLTNTLGLFDPKYRDEALGNYLDLSAAVPALRGIPRLPNQISNYTTKVGRQLSEIERRGAALGLNDFEIAQKQLSDVGITANQRRGYVPGASELFNKYVTPFGYDGLGQSKLAQTFNNIKTGGWEAPRRAAMGNITAESSAAEANAIRNAHRDLNIRDDAWRTYLGMPQKNFTFNMANTAPAMHPAYKPGSLAGMDIYNIPENRVFGTGFDEVTNTIGPHYSLREHGMDALNKPILLDRDHILMGGYNKVLTKDGLQYNDIWDLDPTINFSSLVPKSVKKFMPEKLKEKLFYKDVPISRAQTHPSHTASGYRNQPLIVTQPRQMKIPVSKFIGKPFMSHGNLNYTSTMYTDDLLKALQTELNQIAPWGSASPNVGSNYRQALDLEQKIDLLKSGQYPKYKSGGDVKRVKINALPNNWKTT